MGGTVAAAGRQISGDAPSWSDQEKVQERTGNEAVIFLSQAILLCNIDISESVRYLLPICLALSPVKNIILLHYLYTAVGLHSHKGKKML